MLLKWLELQWYSISLCHDPHWIFINQNKDIKTEQWDTFTLLNNVFLVFHYRMKHLKHLCLPKIIFTRGNAYLRLVQYDVNIIFLQMWKSLVYSFSHFWGHVIVSFFGRLSATNEEHTEWKWAIPWVCGGHIDSIEKVSLR